jgi:predicted metalloprotease with PDZ domain
MNGIDLNRFPFEYDLTWMSFFQDSKGRTYARYGGREDSGPETQLNQKSLIRVMNQTLELHKTGDVKPSNRYEPAPESSLIPEQISTMKQMLAKRKVKCIHCHDVKSTQLKNLRSEGQFKREMIFTYPSPKNLGIQLNPIVQNEIKSVVKRSPAAAAGIRAGDSLKQIDGQRILTFADATRVLELAPETGELAIQVQRQGKTIDTKIELPDQWRNSEDPSWRESTHVAGPNSGFWGVKLDPQQRKRLKIAPDKLALRATAVWGDWAKKAGVRNGDVVVAIDGLSSEMGIKQLQTYLQMNKNWGDTVPVQIIRNGKRAELLLKLPSQPKD